LSRTDATDAGRLSRHTQDESQGPNFKHFCDVLWLRAAHRPTEKPWNAAPGLRYPDCSTLFAEQDMSKPKPHAPPPAQTAEDRLDEALDETFPASDPIAVDPTERPHPTPVPPATPHPDKAKKHH
jgi:hypothetical protein